MGIFYAYEQDDVGRIFGEVSRIQSLGFKLIRIDLLCVINDPYAYLNNQTDIFYAATQQFNISVALVTHNREDVNVIHYYLDRWGNYLTYIQVLNEPELSSSWDFGALYTDDEVQTYFQRSYGAIMQHQLPVQLYTNFEAGYILRANLPIHLSEQLDFVGFDVYMDAFLLLAPNFVNLLQEITGKEVVISEFGMTTSNDFVQSDYLIRGLDLFKNMGLKGCWLVYWNSDTTHYGIRDRLAEQTVGEWIAQNT